MELFGEPRSDCQCRGASAANLFAPALTRTVISGGLAIFSRGLRWSGSGTEHGDTSRSQLDDIATGRFSL